MSIVRKYGRNEIGAFPIDDCIFSYLDWMTHVMGPAFSHSVKSNIKFLSAFSASKVELALESSTLSEWCRNEPVRVQAVESVRIMSRQWALAAHRADEAKSKERTKAASTRAADPVASTSTGSRGREMTEKAINKSSDREVVEIEIEASEDDLKLTEDGPDQPRAKASKRPRSRDEDDRDRASTSSSSSSSKRERGLRPDLQKRLGERVSGRSSPSHDKRVSWGNRSYVGKGKGDGNDRDEPTGFDPNFKIGREKKDRKVWLKDQLAQIKARQKEIEEEMEDDRNSEDNTREDKEDGEIFE